MPPWWSFSFMTLVEKASVSCNSFPNGTPTNLIHACPNPGYSAHTCQEEDKLMAQNPLLGSECLLALYLQRTLPSFTYIFWGISTSSGVGLCTYPVRNVLGIMWVIHSKEGQETAVFSYFILFFGVCVVFCFVLFSVCFLLVYLFCFCFRDRVSVCSFGCAITRSIDQAAGLQPAEICLPLPPNCWD